MDPDMWWFGAATAALANSFAMGCLAGDAFGVATVLASVVQGIATYVSTGVPIGWMVVHAVFGSLAGCMTVTTCASLRIGEQSDHAFAPSAALLALFSIVTTTYAAETTISGASSGLFLFAAAFSTYILLAYCISVVCAGHVERVVASGAGGLAIVVIGIMEACLWSVNPGTLGGGYAGGVAHAIASIVFGSVVAGAAVVLAERVMVSKIH